MQQPRSRVEGHERTCTGNGNERLPREDRAGAAASWLVGVRRFSLQTRRMRLLLVATARHAASTVPTFAREELFSGQTSSCAASRTRPGTTPQNNKLWTECRPRP